MMLSKADWVSIKNLPDIFCSTAKIMNNLGRNMKDDCSDSIVNLFIITLGKKCMSTTP